MIHFECPCCEGTFLSGHHDDCTFDLDCPNEHDDQQAIWHLQRQHDSELAALRACVRAGDELFPLAYDRASFIDARYREAQASYLSSRAKVTLP